MFKLTMQQNRIDVLDEQAVEIQKYWIDVMKKKRTKIIKDDKKDINGRVKKIKARLNQGYTVDEIKKAIDGCAASQWHQGVNDTGVVHNDIELICRNSNKLEYFINLYEKSLTKNKIGLTYELNDDSWAK